MYFIQGTNNVVTNHSTSNHLPPQPCDTYTMREREDYHLSHSNINDKLDRKFIFFNFFYFINDIEPDKNGLFKTFNQ